MSQNNRPQRTTLYSVGREVFILRLSQIVLEEFDECAEGGDKYKIDWRGQLENVRTGEVIIFQGAEMLCSILRDRLDKSPLAYRASQDENTAGLR